MFGRFLGIALAAFFSMTLITYAGAGDKPAVTNPADAANPADPKPDAAKPDPRADLKDIKNVRIIKPFNELRDLTAEQTIRLKQIHRRYSDEIRALELKQKQEMMDVLSETQKKELDDVEMQNRVDKKVKAKAKEEKPVVPAAPAAPAGAPPANPDAPKDPAKPAN